MRKILLLIALLSLASFTAYAQEEDGDDQAMEVQDIAPKPLDWIKSHCIDLPVDVECAVTKSGKIGAADGKDYYFSLYKVHENNIEETGTSVFAQQKDGNVVAVENVLFGDPEIQSKSEPPTLIEYKKEVLLIVPISSAGNANSDIYYILKNGQFTHFDTDSWLSDFAQGGDKTDTKLPKGYAIWKSVPPKFEKDKITATSPVWKESDQNCCATGGKIDLEFDIKDKALVVINQKFQKADDDKKNP